MFYAKSITSLFLCLCIGILTINFHIKSESKKVNKKEVEQKQSEWLKQVNKITSEKPSGSFLVKDKNKREVILEWIKTDLISSEYSATMKSVWNIACPTYTQVEMQFLRAHPEVVGNDDAFKSFEPLFKNGIQMINWAAVEIKMQEHLKSIFLWDSSTCSDEMKKTLTNTAHIFVSVKDKESKEILGFISFLVVPEYAYGDIKCIAFAVKPEEQNRGLGKLLMSSIFKIIPNFNRIFLCTRITNEIAQKAYKNWGFVDEVNPIIEKHKYTFNKDHWIFMEYKTKESNILNN